jgi:dihydrolipoamide dehydrogenase
MRDILYIHMRTITEGIQECLRMLLNKSVFKPHAFPDYMKIRSWNPEGGYQDDK